MRAQLTEGNTQVSSNTPSDYSNDHAYKPRRLPQRSLFELACEYLETASKTGLISESQLGYLHAQVVATLALHEKLDEVISVLKGIEKN